MRADHVPDAQWGGLSAFVARELGLHFPPERRADLERAFGGAAQELGFQNNYAACAAQLLAGPVSPAVIRILASHLTIGETYFFRDKLLLKTLADSVLPGVIRARSGGDQRLRIWSAGCASGEEAYSLAILLHRLLPDFAQWRVTITATDVNPVVLRKAAAGIYGDWSFRDAPAGLKERYFTRTADGRYALVDEIKKLVSFGFLNLAQDGYPSLETGTNAMDVIFCRNVLMYFTPSQMQNVLEKFHSSLLEGGWLAVSPSETSQAWYPQFHTVSLSGVTFYQRKSRSDHKQVDCVEPGAPVEMVPAPETGSTFCADAGSDAMQANTEPPIAPHASAQQLFQQARYAEVADLLSSGIDTQPPEPRTCSLMSRALANLGQLGDALLWCDRWITCDRTDALAHYVRALVLTEQGDVQQARAALQRATYLQPDMVLAHFALGNLADRLGDKGEAHRHFVNTRASLRRYQPDDVIPGSEGLSAGSLAQALASMGEPEMRE